MTFAASISMAPPAAWWLLLSLIVVPALAAAVVAASPAGRSRVHRNIALAGTLVALVLATAAMVVHLADSRTLAQPEPWRFNPLVGLRSTLAVGADGISIWLVMLTAVLMPASVLASARSIHHQTRTFYALLLLLQSAMVGVFLVRDLAWFYVFFEFTLIPLFFIIRLWGGAQRQQAAFKFFIFTLAGSVLTLASILYLGWSGGFGFDPAASFASSQSRSVQIVVFLGLFAGFAIKMPLFPLHTWLPLAHTEAPTAGSVLLAGVLLKLGAYGFLRLGVGFLPEAAVAAAPLLGGLAAAGVIYGALGAWAQNDVKKLVAYSSISHMGFCMLGMFALRPEGLIGSVLVMVNHGLSTGALFLVVGMIYERYHTRRMDELGGIGRTQPALAFFLVFFALSSLGLPGLNGFVGEFLVLLGSFISSQPAGGLPATQGYAFAAIGAFGVVLSAVYLLQMVGKVVFGPPREKPEYANLPDADRREWTILAPLAALVLLLGVWPAPLTRSMQGPTDAILNTIRTTTAVERQVQQPQVNADERR